MPRHAQMCQLRESKTACPGYNNASLKTLLKTKNQLANARTKVMVVKSVDAVGNWTSLGSKENLRNVNTLHQLANV